jgi:hypothetical protein
MYSKQSNVCNSLTPYPVSLCATQFSQGACDVLTTSLWAVIVLKDLRSAVCTVTGWTLIGAKNVSNKIVGTNEIRFVSYTLYPTRTQFHKQTKRITGLYTRFTTCTSHTRQCFSNTHTHAPPPMTVTKAFIGLNVSISHFYSYCTAHFCYSTAL